MNTGRNGGTENEGERETMNGEEKEEEVTGNGKRGTRNGGTGNEERGTGKNKKKKK